MSLGIGGIVSLGGVPGSGTGGSGSGSGITIINPGNNLGPAVLFQGVNGIGVTSPAPNVVLIDGAGASGTSSSNVTKFSAQFVGITSGLFNHGLNTLDVIVQVYASGVIRRQMIPDQIRVETPNAVSVIFNFPTTGYVVII